MFIAQPYSLLAPEAINIRSDERGWEAAAGQDDGLEQALRRANARVRREK